MFVRLTLPGEHVRAEIVARRGDGYAADLIEVIDASPERVTPPCGHFGPCGGCVLQHWNDDAVAAWKGDRVAAALRAAGYQPAIGPIVRVGARARRRMDLAIRRERGRVVIGLHASRSSDIVDITDCHVLHPVLGALIAPLRDALARFAGLRREGSIVANLLDTGPDILLRGDAPLTAADRTGLAAFASRHGIPRISWASGTDAPEIACQLRPATTALAGVTIAPPPGAFLQAAVTAEAAIVAAVLDGIPHRMAPRARIAELYAGCGTLTFALGARGRVDAFEGDAAAAATLRTAVNAARHAGHIAVTTRDLARQPLSPKELAAYEAVVLDPPYAGAAAQVGEIARAAVPRVIYVSCNPAALARDARVLAAAGFDLVSTHVIDQFLWSARIEIVAVFAGRAVRRR